MTPSKTGYRFSLYVNQHMALELGIENLNQAVVFDLIANASSWASPEIIEGEVYYWVARQMVCAQLPFLKMKPDTVYRHFKSLDGIDLIDHKKSGKKDCVRLTAKGKKYFEMNPNNYISDAKNPMSEINPNNEKPYVGNKSESNSEINPTYKTHNTNHKSLPANAENKPNVSKGKDTTFFKPKWADSPKFKTEFDRLLTENEINPTAQILNLTKGSFVDYWCSSTTAKFKKSDWLATWRNWIRNDIKANGWRYRKDQQVKGNSIMPTSGFELPADNNLLPKWAKRHGAPEPKTAADYTNERYRADLTRWINQQGEAA